MASPQRNGLGTEAQLSSTVLPETGMLISIVDDDEFVRASTMDLVTSMGFAAKTFARPDEFLNSEDLVRTSCLITDMRMPGMSGLELHSRVAATGNAIPTILITAFPNERDRVRARQLGVKFYLVKPFDQDELLECVRTAVATARGR
jgi:FixJ family two-component response regulator